jgi:carboxyl-terminal processing protease
VFSDNADEQFAEALTGLLAEGIDELVVDLRDNPGGLLTTAIQITSIFIAEGDVVVTQSPGDSTTYSVTGTSIVPADLDVIFIVNKGSASASEVVSAVLQERGRITVVGENTFGKNTVQQRFGLSNGGALKLTIARWITPEGLDFGGVGVTPDVAMDLEANLDAEDLVEAVLAAT